MPHSSGWKTLELNREIQLLGLPSDAFYEYLDKHDEKLKDYTSECNELTDREQYISFKTPCSKVLKYLETRYDKSDDNCNLLNFWIYGQLVNRITTKNRTLFSPTLKKLNDILNRFISQKNINCKHDKDINRHNDWEIRKKLYDYCVDYEHIKKMHDINLIKCENFYMYIKEKAPLYEHFKDHCSRNDQNMCPYFYKRCELYKPDTVLQTLNCYSDMKRKEASQAEGSRENSDDLDLGGANKNSVNDSNHVKTFGNIFLGVVVTSMTSGVLYKFTPLGRQLRNGMGQNKGTLTNIIGEGSGLYAHTSESFDPYSRGGEEHYIGYHPA
ncbi:unnamed protein product [Plasmodium vivax]|uniref:(malaria parasite P. vivax) hypothetical protein n=1 Tax=Plasmodium vivax TaxID=5855 RepID=A0A1G4E9F8_PLAVI|nr:unnamed protein product [Plasmodium vivax]SCA83666.1 Plasmodium vivax Vir protein, putative [Plasmodium vivax]